MSPCPPVCVLLATAASVGSRAGATAACTVLSESSELDNFNLFPLFPEGSKCVCSLLGHSVSHTGLQTNSRDSFFHCQIPRLGYPTSGSNLLLPREVLLTCDIPLFFCVSSWGHRFQSDHIHSLRTQLNADPFLWLLLEKSLSASLQFIFDENFSACRCISDVFIARHEFNVFLFCHLYLLQMLFCSN